MKEPISLFKVEDIHVKYCDYKEISEFISKHKEDFEGMLKSILKSSISSWRKL